MGKWLLIALFLLLILPLTVSAFSSLDNVNQKVTARFDLDIARLAAIMEEFKKRQGVIETRVAYGEVDTKIEKADYWVNFAAEAIAYQKIQKYSAQPRLKSDLGVLKNKILKAKNEVSKVINEK